MLVYADTTDLATEPWSITDPPANVGRLLASASRLVGHAIRAAVYATDDTGMPTDQAVRDAVRDATCSQVTTWVSLGIDPAQAGIDTTKVVQSKSIGSGSVTYDTAGASSVTAMQQRGRLSTRLTDEAASILADAGLLSPVVAVYG